MSSRAFWTAISGIILMLSSGCVAHQVPATSVEAGQGPAHGVKPLSSDPELEAFLARHAEAHERILNGDVSLWNELASHAEDATLFPPFGGVARGWAEIQARYTAAAARLLPGEAGVETEVHASGVSGDLAYLVRFERARVRLQGSDELRSGFVRVTHILRRENGQWRLLHRHMDHLPESYVPPEH